MSRDAWELLTAGPEDADRSVLLLPGTGAERARLEAAAGVTLVTIPGAVFPLPDEAPEQTAAVIAQALSAVT